MYSSLRDAVVFCVCDILILSITVVLLVHVHCFYCSFVLFSVIALAIGSNFVMPIKRLRERERERGSVSTALAHFNAPQIDSAEHEEQMKVVYLRPHA